MHIFGLLAALLAFFFVGSFTGEVATHNAQAGFFPAVVAALWAGWPFFHKGKIARHNFLHPAPRKYKATSQRIFVQIREILNESTYNLGDRWNVITADTDRNRIVADLRFVEQRSSLEPGPGRPFSIHARTEKLMRFIRLEAQMQDVIDGAIVQLDFDVRAEGGITAACDDHISHLTSSIEVALGPG